MTHCGRPCKEYWLCALRGGVWGGACASVRRVCGACDVLQPVPPWTHVLQPALPLTHYLLRQLSKSTHDPDARLVVMAPLVQVMHEDVVGMTAARPSVSLPGEAVLIHLRAAEEQGATRDGVQRLPVRFLLVRLLTATKQGVDVRSHLGAGWARLAMERNAKMPK